jgi:hypothetical protein
MALFQIYDEAGKGFDMDNGVVCGSFTYGQSFDMILSEDIDSSELSFYWDVDRSCGGQDFP